MTRARRHPLLLLHARIRRARLVLCAALAVLAPAATMAQDWQGRDLRAAYYTEPTTRYPHGVLGDTIEHGALALHYAGRAKHVVIRLPQNRVFEDTAPRITDVDGDGQAEAVVVESHSDKGARLAIYNGGGLIAATPYIGQRNRWLAPIAIADMDGDGLTELAYIDRPHLAKILRIWRFEKDTLTQITALEGLTNHRIGERDIAGGLRDCGSGPEMIVASANWRDLMAVRFDGKQLVARPIGPHKDRSSFAKALACK